MPTKTKTVLVDRDGDRWEEMEDGRLGHVKLAGSTVARSHVEKFAGPLKRMLLVDPEKFQELGEEIEKLVQISATVQDMLCPVTDLYSALQGDTEEVERG